jgi:hypothetical protein
VIDRARINIHYVVTKYVELGTLKWFGEEVTNHFLSQTVLDS